MIFETLSLRQPSHFLSPEEGWIKPKYWVSIPAVFFCTSTVLYISLLINNNTRRILILFACLFHWLFVVVVVVVLSVMISPSDRSVDFCLITWNLAFTYREHKTKEYVKRKAKSLAGKQEPVLATVKFRKLVWVCHYTSAMWVPDTTVRKTIIQGTVEGGRKRERQRKSWSDNVQCSRSKVD